MQVMKHKYYIKWWENFPIYIIFLTKYLSLILFGIFTSNCNCKFFLVTLYLVHNLWLGIIHWYKKSVRIETKQWKVDISYKCILTYFYNLSDFVWKCSSNKYFLQLFIACFFQKLATKLYPGLNGHKLRRAS